MEDDVDVAGRRRIFWRVARGLVRLVVAAVATGSATGCANTLSAHVGDGGDATPQDDTRRILADVVDAFVDESPDYAYGPIIAYGPPPCASDEQCVARHGAGWYCREGYCQPDPDAGAGFPCDLETCTVREVCVLPAEGPPDFHAWCRSFPPECSGSPTCGCVANAYCGSADAGTCTVVRDGLRVECR